MITSVRKGKLAAYGRLYERHVESAYHLARQLTRSPAEADDLVAEAFAKVLDIVRAGHGPDSGFRAYLLTALRHVAYDRTRRNRKFDLTEDVATTTGVSEAAVSVPFYDTVVASLERSMAVRAFVTLPPRWQSVLWYTEIEGQSPAELAPLFHRSPNSVACLAYRAREGLRQAYLQAHLNETIEPHCSSTADRLGAWLRRGLSTREKAQVESHLSGCGQCRARARELAAANPRRRCEAAIVLPGRGGAQ